MDLFSESEEKQIRAVAPLAVRMRPTELEQFVGQQDFVGHGKLLWRMLKADRLSSLIFFGPPGTGKTTLANILANHSQSNFISTNATSVGVHDIRNYIEQARVILSTQHKRTVLFLDEIHRFNKSQQDVLLSDVENGTIVLIGATTENPYFSVNSALVSRSTLFEFHTLSQEDIIQLLVSAIGDSERGLGHYPIEMSDEALEYIAIMSDGDARAALTALEVGVLSQAHVSQEDDKIHFDKALAIESIQKKSLVSDASGDNHYDLASALQKSMRGSDPDATVYWLARLIVGGEDPRFIARRIAVCAAEDVGNADPTATILAAAAVQISEFVGLPEAKLPLAQAAIYIACAPKSNRCTKAIFQAMSDVQQGRTAPVPEHLRDAHYAGAQKMGRGVDYQYPHNYANAFVPQDYMPSGHKKTYYQPSDRGREIQIGQYLDQLAKIINQLNSNTQSKVDKS